MKLILFAALCVMSFFSFAQNKIGTSLSPTKKTISVNSKVSFGIKAGVNVANVHDDQTANTNSLIGFNAGVLAHIHLDNKIAIQPEVTYSMQGAKYPTLGKEKIGYINIPVLVQFMFEQGFRVETGPQLGFVTNAKLERSSGGTTNIKYQFKTIDFSWAFGLGYISGSGLGIDARYNLGLSNIADTKGGLPHVVKNKVWQFGLFYQFLR
jgi:hypothetical protein